jgi:hypothetical protein
MCEVMFSLRYIERSSGSGSATIASNAITKVLWKSKTPYVIARLSTLIQKS